MDKSVTFLGENFGGINFAHKSQLSVVALHLKMTLKAMWHHRHTIENDEFFFHVGKCS